MSHFHCIGMHVPSPHLNSFPEQLTDLTPKQPISSEPSLQSFSPFFAKRKMEENNNNNNKNHENLLIKLFKNHILNIR